MCLMCIPNPRPRLSMERDIWSGEKANVRTIARRIGRNAERVSRSAAPECRRFAGFTLLELMIVIAIIIILLGLAAGRYERSVLVAKEARSEEHTSELQSQSNLVCR